MSERTFTYTNETFSGCDMTAQIVIRTYDINGNEKVFQQIVGELQTVSYSTNMEKRPVRSIGNVNAKDYVMGPRTIAGSLVFSVFNKHFSKNLLEGLNNTYAGTSYLADEIPPFDIVISAANEYGYRSKIVIYGVRLLNEGQVMSINDVYTENTYQFFATDVQYLTDELSYVRSNDSKRYKLIDNITYYAYDDKRFFDYKKQQERLKTIEDYWEAKNNEAITLSCKIYAPTRKNGKGKVEFFLSPGQFTGTLYINSDTEEFKPVSVKAESSNKTDNKHNTTNYFSTLLKSGVYYVYFENGNGVKSDTLKVTMPRYKTETFKKSIIPVIDKLTSTSVSIYIDEDSHNTAELYYDDIFDSYEIVDNELYIDNLTPNTLYTLRTHNEDDTSSSISISFTTPNDNILYKNLITYLKANKKELKITNISDYISIINKYKDLNCTPLSAIKKAYSSFTVELSNLNPNDEDYEEDRDKLEYKKDICSKLLNICYKLDNDYLEALNEDNNIPIPKLYIDKNMNYILQFDKYIDKAEFFIELDDRQQFYMEVDKCSFKTIDDRENCFKFNGKPGTIYSVYTFINQFRSVKYQFYVMINEEKEKYKNDLNEEVNRDEIDKIISSINEDYKDVDNFKDRAFMYSLKKISNPLIINPTIIDINKEEVIVKTNLNDFININYDKTFYLAIANYEDLIANKDIYKIEFRNIDDYIAISYLYHGIKTDTIYAIWIEDEDGVQISNPSTFIYNPNNKSNINLNTTYELKYILDDLLLAVNELSSDNRDSILAILNDTSLSPNELINEILFELSNLLISKQELINFIFNIKKYIGPLIDSNSSMLSNVSFNGTKLTFNSSYINSNLIIYNNDEIYNLTLKENNEIDITNYDNNIIYLLAVNNDISSKSNIIVINKAEKYMEVV